MDTRQHLVEDWKAKLAANSQPAADGGERFAWIRQVYTRIYRFLVSCYGEGEWRGDANDSSLIADLPSTASHMPFVECVPPSDGLLPKSPERIRAALESIHDSNPGIATAGTMRGVEDDSWIVVTSRKKPRFARAARRTLVACGIEARLVDRTTDMAVEVQYRDFQKALAVVQNVGRARKIRISMAVDPVIAVGVVLLIASMVTLVAVGLWNDPLQGTLPATLCALWIAGLAAGWRFVRGRKDR